MRWEVLVMLAVVGAINLIGRIAAHRAKIKAQQAGTLPSAPGSNPATPRVPARAAAGKKPRPAPRAKQPTQGALRPARLEPPRKAQDSSLPRSVSAAPTSESMAGVANLRAEFLALLAKANEGTSRLNEGPSRLPTGTSREPTRTELLGNADRSRRTWNARRLRHALISAEVLGRPAALRSGPSTAGF